MKSVGTAFMASTLFCFLAGRVLPAAILAIPGFFAISASKDDILLDRFSKLNFSMC